MKEERDRSRSSTRPVVYLGGGVRASDAFSEVFDFCELLGAPVVTTLHGKGAFPETHPSCLGMFGMHGSRYANYSIQNSDLIVALGARFDDRVTGKLSTFAPEAKIVHLDVDPAEISKLVTATVPLVGDSMQPSTDSSVVFPLPAAPRTTRVSPCRASNDRSWSAGVASNRRFTCSNRRMSWLGFPCIGLYAALMKTKILVMKNVTTKIQTLAMTTACVVAWPTPWVPPVVRIP